MNALLKITLLFIIFLTVAQPNSTLLGTNSIETGQNIKRTPDGGYVVVGTTNVGGNNDIYVTKINATQAIEWTRRYGNAGNQTGASIALTSDGGYIVIGNTNALCIVLKLELDGDVEWSSTLNENTNNQGLSIIQSSITPIRYTFVCRSAPNLNNWSARVIVIDEDGDFVDGRSFNANENHVASWFNNLILLPDGFLFTGNSDAETSGDFDLWVLRTNMNLGIIWSRLYGSEGEDDGANEAILVGDTSYTIVGVSRFNNSNDMDYTLVSINTTGTEVNWTATYGVTINGASVDDRAYSAKQKQDNGYVITGFSGNNPLLINTNADGEVNFSFQYGTLAGVGNYIDILGDSIYEVGSYNNQLFVNRFGENVITNNCTSPIVVATPRASKIHNAIITTISNQVLASNYLEVTTNSNTVIFTRSPSPLCISLPINFLEIKVIKNQIIWNLETSKNENYNLSIERSIDGVFFYEIGRTSNLENSFFDNTQLPNQLYYYRIKVLEDNSYSNVSSSELINQGISISISEKNKIQVTSDEDLSIEVITLDGKVVDKCSGISHVSLDISKYNEVIILKCISNVYGVKSQIIMKH